MGYETTLLFVEKAGQDGYCSIEATIEMNKVAYNAIGKLLDKRTKDRKNQREEVRKLRVLYNEIYNTKGNYTQEIQDLTVTEREKKIEGYHDLLRKLQNILPYVYYYGENIPDFTDSIGDFLIIVSLKELELAIKENVMNDEKKGEPVYFPYKLALSVIEQFKAGKEHIKIVMWGH